MALDRAKWCLPQDLFFQNVDVERNIYASLDKPKFERTEKRNSFALKLFAVDLIWFKKKMWGPSGPIVCGLLDYNHVDLAYIEHSYEIKNQIEYRMHGRPKKMSENYILIFGRTTSAEHFRGSLTEPFLGKGKFLHDVHHLF